ncbi:hypothetical protein KC19_2G136400 [Ceratodon purpureus]|uniref:Uncharacterized protein n=1 Tax=Ceratodon purpureus TaxID=3225 RepID=A0A8T0IV83_CERPU|nr:hypothetical protein KC19_2G136400 [Ceratodon purpureus]
MICTPHCYALWADTHSQKRCSTDSSERRGHTGQLTSTDASNRPRQWLTAIVRCHTSQRSPASLLVRSFVHTDRHFKRKSLGRIPCHFLVTGLFTTIRLRSISLPILEVYSVKGTSCPPAFHTNRPESQSRESVRP